MGWRFSSLSRMSGNSGPSSRRISGVRTIVPLIRVRAARISARSTGRTSSSAVGMAYTTVRHWKTEGTAMFRLKEAALLAAGLAMLAGCTAKAPDVAPIEAMIRAHTTGWVEAYNAGDVDKVVASYTPDAVVMPPEAPAATGTEAIKQYLAGDMAASKAAGT